MYKNILRYLKSTQKKSPETHSSIASKSIMVHNFLT